MIKIILKWLIAETKDLRECLFIFFVAVAPLAFSIWFGVYLYGNKNENAAAIGVSVCLSIYLLYGVIFGIRYFWNETKENLYKEIDKYKKLNKNKHVKANKQNGQISSAYQVEGGELSKICQNNAPN